MVFSNNDVLQMRGTPSNQDQSSQGQKVQGKMELVMELQENKEYSTVM